MERLIRTAAALVAVALASLPEVAAACPACLGQNRNNTVLKVVGAFMLVPFGVFLSVLRTVRRAQRDTQLPPQ